MMLHRGRRPLATLRRSFPGGLAVDFQFCSFAVVSFISEGRLSNRTCLCNMPVEYSSSLAGKQLGFAGLELLNNSEGEIHLSYRLW